MTGSEVLARLVPKPGNHPSFSLADRAARAANILGVSVDDRFISRYRDVLKNYSDSLIDQYMDPVDARRLASQIDELATDPLTTLRRHLARELDPQATELVQAAVAEGIDEGGWHDCEPEDVPYRIVAFASAMQAVLTKEVIRYRSINTKRGPKQNQPLLMLICDIYIVAERYAEKLALPSNERADEDTPLISFAEAVVSDATEVARLAVNARTNLGSAPRGAAQRDIERGADLPRRSLLEKLRKARSLRIGGNLRSKR